MNAYFIKCRNNVIGSEAISTTLYYFESQAQQIVDQLNAKKDGYTYFIYSKNI
jgi:hypothetical protein